MNSIRFGSKSFIDYVSSQFTKTIIIDDKVIAYKHVLDFIYYALYANVPIVIKGHAQHLEAIKTICFERKIATVNLSSTELIYHVKSKDEKKIDNSCVFSFTTLLNECKVRYEKLYNPVFEGKSNFDLITASFTHRTRISLVPLSDYLEVSESEYQAIIVKLEEALHNYDDNLDSYINLPLKQIFHKIKIEESTSYVSKIEQVGNHLTSLKLLKDKYIEALEHEIYLMKESNVQKVKEIKDLLLTIKVAIDSFEDQYGLEEIEKPSIFNFSKADKLRYESYQNLLSEINRLDAEIKQRYSSAYNSLFDSNLLKVKQDIVLAIEVLPHLEDQLHEQSRIYIKRINHLNDTKFTFSQLFQSLSDLLKEMNESDHYNERFECNARSTLMQHEWLENLIKDIDLEVRQLKILPKFFQWTNYINAQDLKIKKLINALITFPKEEWQEIFKNSYLHFYKNEKITLNSVVDQDSYATLIHNYHTVKSHIVNNSQIARETLHKAIFKYFKSNDSKTYKTIKETGKIDQIGGFLEKLPAYYPCVYLDMQNNSDISIIDIYLGL
ncbi:MAG TPA: hypothetical protein PKD85_11130, partial [Saprospiraceae bacterium]|nr:hypothetical protein [Saprospiraceae bacterium]